MNSDNKTNKTGLAARIRMAVAGLALAGILAGGASAVVDIEPISSEDTTETAKTELRVPESELIVSAERDGWSYSRGVSWQ